MAIRKHGKYVDIILTDIQLHVAKPRKPSPLSKAIGKSLKNNKPGRFYKRDFSVTKDGTIQLPIFENSEIMKIKEKYEKEGKIVRFFMPKSGLDIYAGKDTIEHIEAKEKRMVDKKKN